MRFKIDWASLACSGNEITIFALFYLVFEGKFQVQASRGAYTRRGDLTEGFLRYDSGGLIFGGAYKWRGLFLEFYGSLLCSRFKGCHTTLLLRDEPKNGCEGG